MKVISWIFFIFFAVVIGLYPFSYLLFDMAGGFLASKDPDIKMSAVWNTTFYLHILAGAVSMLVGWVQFSKRFRVKYLRIHRVIGKTYLYAVLVSGASGLYIALYANGGIISSLGFTGLAAAWLFTTLQAYAAIRRRDTDIHRDWMIRSYALTFAAVTLRIWLPLFQFAIGMDFIVAYRIISWLCWVPNILIAEMIVRSVRTRVSPGRA